MLFVSDIRFFREGLAQSLSADPTMVLCGAAEEIGGALALIDRRRPDVVLLDAAHAEGLAIAGQLRATVPGVAVVGLGVAERTEDVLAWAGAGVIGYIPRSTGLDTLADRLRGIVQGEQICSERIACALFRRLGQPASLQDVPAAGAMAMLTERELEIAGLVERGLSNKEIARSLRIGVSTTKSHVHNLLAKLQVQRRSQAALWLRAQRESSRAAPASVDALPPAAGRPS